MYEGQSATAKSGRFAASETAMIDGPRSATPIRDALSRLEELVQHTHGGVSALSERLDVVLRPSSPEPVTTVAKNVTQRSIGSHLEDRILSLVSSIAEVNAQMQNIHGRIEL